MALRYKRQLECLDLRTIFKGDNDSYRTRIYTEWSLDTYSVKSDCNTIGACVPRQFFYCWENIFLDIGTYSNITGAVLVFTQKRNWRC